MSERDRSLRIIKNSLAESWNVTSFYFDEKMFGNFTIVISAGQNRIEAVNDRGIIEGYALIDGVNKSLHEWSTLPKPDMELNFDKFLGLLEKITGKEIRSE